MGPSALTGSPAFAADGGSSDSGADEEQYGFMVRVGNCVDCERCVEACRKHNGTPDNVAARRKITAYKKPNGKTVYIPTSCMQCAEPACLTVCPAGAISKGKGGIVVVDHDRCIGCKYCYQACPYGVPHYTSEGMDKCDCCLGNGVELGDTPWCVKACRFDALEYGKISDLIAKTNGQAQQMEGTTGPSFLLR